MSSINICRFTLGDGTPRVGLAADGKVRELVGAGLNTITALLQNNQLSTAVQQLSDLPQHPLANVTLLPPVDRQEVWAAGVTYLRSKKARMEESEFSASAYDRVYEAERPEIFFKSVPEKVVGPKSKVGIRRDGKWNVPEPELALVINPSGKLVGFTIGNDMSSRDIEGENLLYLPQAKVYKASCALGPWITLAAEDEARGWDISVDIARGGSSVFSGTTKVSQIKRTFDELIEFLFRSQEFPNGAVLLTGTGVVPPDNFTLAPQDVVTIRISGIGELQNEVVEV